MLDEVDVMNFKIQKGKSVVGLYACNAKSETVTMRAKSQKGGDDVASCLTEMIRSAVEGYIDKAEGLAPGLIVLYRDGVSSGSMERVKTEEIEQVRNGLGKDLASRINVVYIAVNKKPANKYAYASGPDAMSNVPCGVVVDALTDVGAVYESFYLYQTSKNTPGSSIPTQYTVLVNERSLSLNIIKQLTNELCYADNWLWTASTKVPGVCKNAYKVAKQVAEETGVEADRRLWATPYAI